MSFVIKKVVIFILLIVGLSLTGINFYGVFVDIRPGYIFDDELRFPNDQATAYDVTLAALQRNKNENDRDYATRATEVVSRGIAHIHWFNYEPRRFNQLVPIWENYFLYFIGRYSGIPEYERYHFTDYKRSLRRGIGVCGDASMVLSQVLALNNIENQIISFPSHVVVETKIGKESLTLDADFGVVLPFSINTLKEKTGEIEKAYMSKGYSLNDANALNDTYQESFQKWGGVQFFVTNKYYFEKFSYIFKWLLPLLFILFSMFCSRRFKL